MIAHESPLTAATIEMKPVVQHVITSLATGGAERMLQRIILASSNQFEHRVITLLKETGPIEERLRGAGIRIAKLGYSTSALVAAPAGISAALRQQRPNVCVGWLHHGNAVAALLSFAVWRVPAIINVRNTFGTNESKRGVVRALKAYSPLAFRVLANSQDAVMELRREGFRGVDFVPNGFDTIEFAFRPSARAAGRLAMGIDDSAILIGAVGRAHPMKNHSGFIRAVSALMRKDSRIYGLLAGRGVVSACNLAVPVDVKDRWHLFDEVNGVAELMSSLDVFVQNSSFGEGFPNVLAEAMLCERPVLATRIGESAQLVACERRMVCPGDELELEERLAELTACDSQERSNIGRQNRESVAARFSLDLVVPIYTDYYQRAMAG